MSAQLTVILFHNKQNCLSFSFFSRASDGSKSCEITYSKKEVRLGIFKIWLKSAIKKMVV